MGNIELKVDPEQLVQLKPYLERNDFRGAYDLIREFKSYTQYFTELFLHCGIDPLDYMDEVPNSYAYHLHDYQFSLPDHIKKVGREAFDETGVYTANLVNVEKIDEEAFSYCKNLNTIKIGDKLQTIPINCFVVCTSLKTVELPINVKLVDDLAFANCENLSHVIIHNPDCDISFNYHCESFYACPADMLVEVRSEKLANKFIKYGFKNVKVF